MIALPKGYAGFFFPRKMAALPRAMRGVVNRAVLGRPHLRVAEIAVTFACNSRCVMCSCANMFDPGREKERMGVEEYRGLGRSLDKLGCVSVNVTGGEPLMRKDIESIIDALNPRNKIVNLITNGIALTKEMILRLKRIGVDGIVMSLESANPRENDGIRGYEGHFEAVMNALAWTREARVNAGLSLTLGDFNFGKIDELLSLARAQGAFLCIAHGGDVGNWTGNGRIRLSESNARKVLDLVRRRKRVKIDFSANLGLKPGCPAVREKIYVTPYGEVLPCTFIPISFGNVRAMPLEAVWPRMVAFRQKRFNSETLCLRCYDSRFIKEFLDPVASLKPPVPIESHPAFASGAGA